MKRSLFKLIIFSVMASFVLIGAPGKILAADCNEVSFDAWNMECVGTVDTDPSFPYSKLAPWPHTNGRYLYSGCYTPLQCWMAVDVKDPENPVRISTTYTHDLDLSPQPPAGHPVWSSPDYDDLAIAAPCGDWVGCAGECLDVEPTCWDPGWNTHSHFVSMQGNILAANQERKRVGGTNLRPNWHGIAIYDVSKPAKPVFLSRFQTPSAGRDPVTRRFNDTGGVHHFHFDGRYVYMGGTYEGFENRILVIVDLKDPDNPVEAGKWWVPGQHESELAIRDWIPQSNFSPVVVDAASGKLKKGVGLHWCQHQGNRLYMSYHQAGLIILDVSDQGDPQLISRLDYLVPGYPETPPEIDEVCMEQNGGQPAACGNTHSAKLIPGSNQLWITDEYFNCPYGFMRLVDLSDEENPQIVSSYYYPETVACEMEWPERGPSSHLGNSWNSNLLFMAWYGLGVRAFDVSDIYNPEEVGFYEYEISEENAGMATYDAIFGPGGYIYASDSVDGLRVLKWTGKGKSGKY